MKRIYFISILFLLISCHSEFNSKSQATNEVNKKGFREGRWVDYFDNNYDVVTDTTRGYQYYSLSEYDNGMLEGNIRVFLKSGSLKMLIETYADSNKQVGISSKSDDLRIKKKNIYFEDGSTQSVSDFNSNGKLVNKSVYNNKGIMLSRFSLKYFNNGLVKSTDEKQYILNDKNSTVDSIRWRAEFLESSVYDQLGKNTRKTVIAALEKYPLELRTRIVSSENLRDLPFRLKSMSVKMSKLEEKEFPIKVIIEEVKKRAQSEGGAQIRECYYCGRSFNVNTGFVQGLQISCASSYSLAMENIELARRAGYPAQQLNILRQSYLRGVFFCSRRCVVYSGVSFCGM